MKKSLKNIAIILVFALLCMASISLVACNQKPDDSDNPDIIETLTFSAPEGTPALAMLRLVTDNQVLANRAVTYKVVKPATIASEMSAKNSDIVIMPVNGGANLIRMGANYKLVSIAVDGSLYMVGSTHAGGEISLDDIKGKRIACIGQTGVPGLVFRYVMSANGIDLADESDSPNESQVSVQYVNDGSAAATLLASGRVDFMVVGEPAATAQTNRLKLNAQMNMQTEYAKVSGVDNYPQAGLFVRSDLALDETFMKALFDALSASKTWVSQNASEVGAFAKENLYESAVFPVGAVPRCAINATRLDETQKIQIITFLEKVMPKDSAQNAIDWQSAKSMIF